MSRKKYISILASLLSLLPILTQAQTLSKYEYWFDDNFKGRHSKSLSGTNKLINTSISTDGLENGVHKFSFRAKQSDGYYSAVTSSLFLKRTAALSSNMEYWFDDNIDQRESISIGNTEEEQAFELDLRDNNKFPMGFHQLNIRVTLEGGSESAVYSSPVLKLSAGTATALEYWIDDDIANARTFEGHLASDGKDYIFVSDLDLGDITPGYHRLYCRAVSSSKRTVSAVTMTPIMVKSRYYNNPMVTYNDPKMIQYTIGVDEKEPVTYPIQNVAKEVEITHTFDASDLTNGKHLIKMDFWNSSLKNVTDTFSFVAKTTGKKLATPKPSTFKATNIAASGFKASWEKVQGALYYDILVKKKDGGDYEHPDFKGGSSGTEVEVTRLQPNTSYLFQVRARNDNSNEASDWSASIPNAVKTTKVSTAPADIVIHSTKGFDGSQPLTLGKSYHYNVWIANKEDHPWQGSFYLKDGDDNIKEWYNLGIPDNSVRPLEFDYMPENVGTKDLVLYYQTMGKGSEIPVNTRDGIPNTMRIQIVTNPTFYNGLNLASAIVCPETIQRGNSSNISASIINNGEDSWTGTLYITDNGLSIKDKKVTLSKGKKTTLVANEWLPETLGTHQIGVYYMSENASNWQLVSGNNYSNPTPVEVMDGNVLADASLVTITNVTKDVVPSEVTVGSTVFHYFRLTDGNGNRLKGLTMIFKCYGSSLINENATVATTASGDDGIAVLCLKTEGYDAIAARGDEIKLVCSAVIKRDLSNVQFMYEPSDGEIALTIHKGNAASIESGFENVDKMKFTLDLGLSAKANLGNYVKANGSISFPLSLTMKFDDNGEFKNYSYDSKIKGSASASIGDFAEQGSAQNNGSAAIIPQGSIGISGGFHYNFSSDDWRDIFKRVVMNWCDAYSQVTDWKTDVAIKALEAWYESRRDYKETTNWFVGGEVGASVDMLNINELPSFSPRPTAMPLMKFPELELGGKVSFNFDCNIKKTDYEKNRTLYGDGGSYKIKGEFKAKEKVRNLYSDAQYWWNTSVKHGFFANQLNNFYVSNPVSQNLSSALSMKSEELFDDYGNMKEVSHEMSLEEGWELSFDKVLIPWNPLDADDAKMSVTTTSTSKLTSTEDWATFIGKIATDSPNSKEAEYVRWLYPNLNYKRLFVAPGEIYSFWKNPPIGSLEKLVSKAPDPSIYKLKDAFKLEESLSSELTMAVKIPVYKPLNFSMDVGANIGIYNKPTTSYYSMEDKRFFPVSIHPTTSIKKITGWLLRQLADKIKSIFDNENDIVNYIPMDDAYGEGLVLGTKTFYDVPGLPHYDESLDLTQPMFLYNDDINPGEGGGGGGGSSFMPRRDTNKSSGMAHYMLDNFENDYAKYIIRRHPRLGERIQRDICSFTFCFNDGVQNFDEGMRIKIPHYYPAGDLLAITNDVDTVFVVSEVCNVIAQYGDSVFKKTQRGEFEITGYVGADDLTPFGFPENQHLDVYYCEDGSKIWQYVGPAGMPLKVDKLGAYMMAISIKEDVESPNITAMFNEETGLMHINVSDNIGVRVNSLQVYVNGERKEVVMINEANFELLLSEEELMDTIMVNISIEDLAGNQGSLTQMFNVNPHLLLGDVNGDKDINVNDVMMIVSHILGTTPSNFIKRNADLDRNESIDVKDLMQVVYIILYNEYPHAPADARHDTGDNILLAANNNGCSICLDGNGSFNACEMTLSLPEGCILQDASLDNRQPGSHQVMVNKLNDGRYRLVVFTPSDRKTILSEGAMVNLALSGRADGIKVSDIIFCNSQYETFVFSDVMGITTGMDGISASDSKGDTYSIQGIKTTTPKKGVYIKDRKKKAVK